MISSFQNNDFGTSLGASSGTSSGGHSRTSSETSLGGKDIFLRPTASRPYPLRAHVWTHPNPKACLLFLPGFTEFCEKYADFAEWLVGLGYACLLIDWPGQGRSGHLGSARHIVHIDDFTQHLSALDMLLHKANWHAHPLTVIGHSMGAHLALRLAHSQPHRIKSLILLSPMIIPCAPPLWFTKPLIKLLLQLGQHQNPLPFTTDQHPQKFYPHNKRTRDIHGYEWPYRFLDSTPELYRLHPSIGWLDAAFRSCTDTTLDIGFMSAITCPTLSLLAGDERIVNLKKSRQMLAHLPQNQQIEFPSARHELLHETPETLTKIRPFIHNFLTKFTP